MHTINNFVFIIPARMGSSRFYGKPLKTINNKAIIELVYENCLKSKYCKEAIVATDSEEILFFCRTKSINCILTKDHNCASNRVSEVCKNLKDRWIVEIQGDEPLLDEKIMNKWINKCIRAMQKKCSPDIFLSYAKLDSKNADNFNYVKLLLSPSKDVLWFSRSKLPSDWKGNIISNFYRHTGFHLWKRESLLKFSKIRPSNVEISEDTHAVRLVENKFEIKGVEIIDTQAIDIPNDLYKARKIYKSKEL
tara:strand:+ start:710 stop:1459 length:750 start_codon:yes stop_codon:yes gene_type:complete